MRIVYLDFPINYGGAPQAMVYLVRRLAERHEVHVVDAYGACAAYRQAVADAGLSYCALAPETKRTYIGGHGVGRLWAALRQSPALWRLRDRLIRKICGREPDVILLWGVKPLTFVALSRRLRRYRPQCTSWNPGAASVHGCGGCCDTARRPCSPSRRPRANDCVNWVSRQRNCTWDR